MDNIFEQIFNSINFFDFFVVIVLLYNVVQSFLKGFSLSLISFMKWVLSTVVTIILVPKFQPMVSNYIQSDFINNIGLGLAVFFITLFIIILVGKTSAR